MKYSKITDLEIGDQFVFVGFDYGDNICSNADQSYQNVIWEKISDDYSRNAKVVGSSHGSAFELGCPGSFKDSHFVELANNTSDEWASEFEFVQ